MSLSSVASSLKVYLEMLGPGPTDHVFLYRNQALSKDLIHGRLKAYGERVNVTVNAHRLRHTCATQLLNAGCRITSIQKFLGHKRLNTTLGYARLYDGTVAADYYQAMSGEEKRLALPEDRLSQPRVIGKLLALVDALHEGTLNPTQTEIMRQLRTGIMAFAEPESVLKNVKVQSDAP